MRHKTNRLRLHNIYIQWQQLKDMESEAIGDKQTKTYKTKKQQLNLSIKQCITYAYRGSKMQQQKTNADKHKNNTKTAAKQGNVMNTGCGLQ